MNWIMDMALRNIRRNTRRTVLAAASIALSVMLMTFLAGFVAGVLDNMVKNLTKNETGHVRVIATGYYQRERFRPIDELVPDPDAVMRAIEGIEKLPGGLATATDRIMFGTLLSNGPNTKAAVGFAGDAAKEAQLFDLDRSLTDGRYIDGPGQVIIGAGLADDLGFGVGDTVRVVSTGADYALHLKRFTIVGLFGTGLSQLDESFFQLPVADAQDFLRTGGGSQQVLVMLNDYRKADQAAEAIRAALAGVPGTEGIVVQAWTEVGDFPRLIRMMEGIYRYIFIVIAFLGAFIITNILMMVVLERRKEIGILKALGLRRRDVLGLFLAEGALMGAIGSGIGAALGMGLCWVSSKVGLDFSSAMSSVNFPMDPVFYSRFNLADGALMFALGFLVSVVMSITPSRRAATMNAVDAIKSVA